MPTLSKDDVGSQARLATDGRASAARTLNRNEVMKIWRLGGCKYFVGK